MKIIDILREDRLHLSCELFPPKQGAQLANVDRLIGEIAALGPSYISVTYGASGGTSAHTVHIADLIQNRFGVPALAHLTCASSTHEQVQQVIGELKAVGVENILALRGDIPEDADFPLPNQYRYASELTAQIRASGDFCIGGACYPEGHPEAESMQADIGHLRHKLDAGCDFLTTQMFFDNHLYYQFVYRLRNAGIRVPVVPGIMPVTNGKMIKRTMALSGNMLPPKFRSIIEKYGDKPAAMEQAGIVYATEQIVDLAANGVNNIHIYTMNKPHVARKIFENLSELIGT